MMESKELMNWQVFKQYLGQSPELTLQFQYAGNSWVDASYHITEIKQAPIVSVDCGGQMDSWTEIIVQLWEPAQGSTCSAMQVNKALSIIELVEKTLPLNPFATVKVEFGNSRFDTRQMYPAEILVQGDNLVVDLTPDFTQCKAISRGGSCNTDDRAEVCCPTVETEAKPRLSLKNLVPDKQLCTPGSGCC